MDWLMGIIAGVGLGASMYLIKAEQKKFGYSFLALSILLPLAMAFFCAQKEKFVFGGTDFEFLWQAATVDKMLEPWALLALLVLWVVLAAIAVKKLRRINNK